MDLSDDLRPYERTGTSRTTIALPYQVMAGSAVVLLVASIGKGWYARRSLHSHHKESGGPLKADHASRYSKYAMSSLSRGRSDFATTLTPASVPSSGGFGERPWVLAPQTT